MKLFTGSDISGAALPKSSCVEGGPFPGGSREGDIRDGERLSRLSRRREGRVGGVESRGSRETSMLSQTFLPHMKSLVTARTAGERGCFDKLPVA